MRFAFLCIWISDALEVRLPFANTSLRNELTTDSDVSDDLEYEHGKACVSDSRVSPVRRKDRNPGLARLKSEVKVPYSGPVLKKIFYINLEESKERRKHVTMMLDSVLHGSIAVERWPAVAAETLRDEDWFGKKSSYETYLQRGVNPELLTYSPHLRWGSIGCYLSHVKLLENIASFEDDGLYMVIEDDVAIDPNFRKSLEHCLEEVPQDWDVLRIGWWGLRRCQDQITDKLFLARSPFDIPKKENQTKSLLERLSTIPLIMRPSDNFYAGTQGYLTTPSRARKVLKWVEGQNIDNIDNLLMTTDGVEPSIRVYAYDPFVHSVIDPFPLSDRFHLEDITSLLFRQFRSAMNTAIRWIF